jgi:hypothetical protein
VPLLNQKRDFELLAPQAFRDRPEPTGAQTHDHKEVYMKLLALKKSYWVIAAMFVSFVSLVGPQKSFAADTEVTCKTPQVQLAAGRDATKPRVTILCAGGSSVSPINYFAAEISANATVAAAIPTMVGDWLKINGAASSITIYTDLSDTSGVDWGCGESNCRIIDYVVGY